MVAQPAIWSAVSRSALGSGLGVTAKYRRFSLAPLRVMVSGPVPESSPAVSHLVEGAVKGGGPEGGVAPGLGLDAPGHFGTVGRLFREGERGPGTSLDLSMWGPDSWLVRRAAGGHAGSKKHGLADDIISKNVL